MVPVYRASKDLTTRKIATVVRKNIDALLDRAPADPMPASIARGRNYPSLREAYRSVHLPESPEEAQRARGPAPGNMVVHQRRLEDLHRAEREAEQAYRALKGGQ